MCGIAGFRQAQRGDTSPTEILSRMGAALQHRGPDDHGEFWDAQAGLGLVFRRLAILDLSPAGHQPMRSASGRYTIIFNGEVYNYEEIRRELGEGHHWRGHSDTEVLLAAFERWGLESALRRFVGMFAIALWDSEQRMLHLVRDRLGIKPLYYGWVGGDFVFASELKAIRRYPGFEGRISPESVALFMRHNYVPTPHCIYEGIAKLPAGCVLTLVASSAEAKVQPYWSATEIARAGIEQRKEDDASRLEELQQKLMEAVRLRMIADVPLGAFLSGGIDSSTVVALMQAQSSRPVKTFTIGFHEDGYNEAAWAKRIAEHLGTEHTELYLGAKDCLAVIPQLPAMFDEPFADSSQIPTYLVSKLARGSVTVALSGDGGDELFGGYQRYFLTRTLWRSLRRVPRWMRRTVAGTIRAVPPAGWDSANRLARPLVPRGRRVPALGDKAHKLAGFLALTSEEELYLRALTHWTPAEIMPDTTEPTTVLDFVQATRGMPSIEERMMLTDLAHYLPDDILTKVDRASMAVSLEARVPLLDHRVVEFAWRMPLSAKIRGRQGKWALRQILSRYVPSALVERPKMGFGVPIEHWLRGPLRDWCEELLSPARLSEDGLFDTGLIRSRWEEHRSGARNWHHHLWDVLMFQAWRQENRTLTRGELARPVSDTVKAGS